MKNITRDTNSLNFEDTFNNIEKKHIRYFVINTNNKEQLQKRLLIYFKKISHSLEKRSLDYEELSYIVSNAIYSLNFQL